MSFQLISYILMDGRAKEAIAYYQETLNAKVLFKQTLGDGPTDEVSKVQENELELIAHAVLQIGDTQIMIADRIPSLPFQQGNQISICITCSDIAAATQLYENLKEKGHVVLELQDIYFSPAYGMVTDPFGVTFQIFTAKP